MRQRLITIDEALSIQTRAEQLMSNADRPVHSEDVLRLANSSQCTAYDCEFVALAEELGVRLITDDKQLLQKFPQIAVSLADAL
jgi:predicted nucleic acid-binding protein